MECALGRARRRDLRRVKAVDEGGALQCFSVLFWNEEEGRGCGPLTSNGRASRCGCPWIMPKVVRLEASRASEIEERQEI